MAVTARRLAAAFVLYGLLATALLAVIMPPFHNPDEAAHFWRATQIAGGGLVGHRFFTLDEHRVRMYWAGGYLDAALFDAYRPTLQTIDHPEAPVTKQSWAPRVHWSDDRMMLAFTNTAVYPPVFYIPAAVGVLVGRATRMTVTQTLILSRLLTGAAAVALAAVAIACAGDAAVWLFAVLTLPTSMSLIASPSQDALMLACSALAGALLARSLRPAERSCDRSAGRTGGIGCIGGNGAASVRGARGIAARADQACRCDPGCWRRRRSPCRCSHGPGSPRGSR